MEGTNAAEVAFNGFGLNRPVTKAGDPFEYAAGCGWKELARAEEETRTNSDIVNV